jgi:hypothetical protein
LQDIKMAENGPRWLEDILAKTGTLEHELTEHLQRAHELGERAKESNDVLFEQLRRAGEIADELKDRFFADDIRD